MKHFHNIKELLLMNTDFIGFIFYKNSKRFIEDTKSLNFIRDIKPHKVAVFVNEDKDKIVEIYKKFYFDFVQLHGEESPNFCKELAKQSINIIKAFSVDDSFDFNSTYSYCGIAKYFIFDSKAKGYGGTGKKFNWSVLDRYNGETPFFLSGGIDLSDIHKIKKINNPKLIGVDINSKFEILPGLKDMNKIKKFMELI